MRLHFHQFKWGKVEGCLSRWNPIREDFTSVVLQEGVCQKCGFTVWKELEL